jgi:crotonobetainyl-CoA:carnitine CoA-transferase CaiB-like acyl-CoA transferase
MRVLELSTLFPGPLAGRLLLQLGFEVVKVEPPAGDPTRQVSPTLYKVLNEGKEIIYIDLKDSAEKVRRLAEEVDAVLSTFKPSTAERYGISYRKLAEAKPDLIYVAVMGYRGDEYPRDHPSHDINFAALAGAVGPCPPYVQAVDVVAGLLAALTITAMAARGERGYVEIPMSRAAALVNILNLSLRRDGKPLLLSGDYPFYTVYRYRGGRGGPRGRGAEVLGAVLQSHRKRRPNPAATGPHRQGGSGKGSVGDRLQRSRGTCEERRDTTYSCIRHRQGLNDF